MSTIRFNYANVKPVLLGNKRLIKEFVIDLIFKEGKSVDIINYIFCSDEYLIEINKSFLNHDFYTDIISFDLSEGSDIIGEIYVSIDRVKENSISHSEKYKTELLRVIFHGALHLCGYRDKKKSEITVMRQKEDYYLRLWKEKFK